MQFIRFGEEGETLLDRIFITLLHSSLVTIILIHTLVFIKIYETFSLVLGYALAVYIYYEYQRRHKNMFIDSYKHNAIMFLLEHSDCEKGIRGTIATMIICKGLNLCKKIVNCTLKYLKSYFHVLLLFPVLGAAAYVRFRHPLLHEYYIVNDSYVHLAWTKYLGNNQIYRDGIYPYGYEAILSAIHKIFFIDPIYIIRFVGPLGGMLLVLSIYYFLKKNFKWSPILLFTALFAYIINNDSPNNILRQMSAIPQEYAMIFYLPGLYYLNTFFKKDRKVYLILATECLALSLFVHLYVTVFMIAGYALIALSHYKKLFIPRFFVRFSAVMIGALLFALLPILVGFLTGAGFHMTSVDFIAKSASGIIEAEAETGFRWFVEWVGFLTAMLNAIVAFCIMVLVGMMVKRDEKFLSNMKFNFVFVVLAMLLYYQFRSPETNFPSVIDYTRSGVFLGLVAVVIYAIVFDVFDMFIKAKFLSVGVKILLCVFFIWSAFQFKPFFMPPGDQVEYDEAVLAYHAVKNEFPIQNWTIVAPVEQYQQCLGYGYHYNLWEFVHDAIEGKKNEVLIPTDYIFFFVEKLPLHSDEAISVEDAKKNTPVLTGELDMYYKDAEIRKILQSKLYYWAESYMAKSNNMEVYLDYPNFRVYVIKQNGQKPENLAPVK